MSLNSVIMDVSVEKWPLKAPLTITGYCFEAIEVVVVTLERAGEVGRGEAAGVYYLNDDIARINATLAQLRPKVERGLSRQELQGIAPAGGARNALDCALWELEANIAGRPIWGFAGMAKPRPLMTTVTCSAGAPEKMAEDALLHASVRALKLKLLGDAADRDRVIAVREARKDVWLGVDANQGFERPFLEWLMPTLVDANVSLIEQPFRRGHDKLLEGFGSPIPIAADESLQDLKSLDEVCELYDVINIKLDKCGGLTEGLELAHEARSRGLGVMVGNMMGTSLSAAPAFLVGQYCDVVDLDGPLLLARDRQPSVDYSYGLIDCSQRVWGSGAGDAE